MRKECPKCRYGTSKRGRNGDKALARHFSFTNHHKTNKEWKGYKKVSKKK